MLGFWPFVTRLLYGVPLDDAFCAVPAPTSGECSQKSLDESETEADET